MQTTLLGVAIAFIVALTSALIGPHFIDWNQYRPQFEAAAARVVGVPVRVGGDMSATLLPVPSLQLQSVEIGDGLGDLGRARADRLSVEFNLGALMRGNWRATELTINGMALDFGLDWRGRIAWPAGMGGVDLGALAIDRLNVTGRVTLHDGASRSQIELEDIAFAGDVRALAGWVRGEGNASIKGVRYPFRINSSPTDDGEGVKLHVSAAASHARVSTIDLDGELRFAASVPRFEGGLTLEHRAETADAGQPEGAWGLSWRIATRVKADPASARFEQIDISHGADELAGKFSGSGEWRFGAAPQLRATLTSRQINADRVLAGGTANGTVQASSAASSASWPAVWPALRDALAGVPLPPLPVLLDLSADTLSLGGRPVQNLKAVLRSNETDWVVESLSALAPGTAQIALRNATILPGGASGGTSGGQGGFRGKIELDAAEPAVFAAWLRGEAVSAEGLRDRLRLSGDLTADASHVQIEHFRMGVDGDHVQGRLLLSGLDQPGEKRLEASLTAQRLDLDALATLIRGASKNELVWPDQVALSLDVAHAVVAGQDIRPVALQLDYGADTVHLKRLTFGAADGVQVEGFGQFDRASMRGKMEFDAAAASFAKVATLLEPVAPHLAKRFGALPEAREKARLKLAVTLDKDSANADFAALQAAFDLEALKVKGEGTLKLSLPFAAPFAAMKDADQAGLSSAGNMDMTAKLVAAQPGPLLAAFGLQDIVMAEKGETTLSASMTGDAGKPMRITAKLVGAALDADIVGTASPFKGASDARMRLTVRRATLTPHPGHHFGVAGSARLAWSEGGWQADEIDALIGGTRLRGSLKRAADRALDGDLSLDKLQVAEALGYFIGDLAARPDTTASAADEGDQRGFRGRIAFQAAQAALSGGTELQSLSGVLRAEGGSLALDTIKGSLGGGEALADLDMRQTSEGMILNTRLTLNGVQGDALRYRALRMPSGQIGLQMSLASRGRSLDAMLGAMSGSGTVVLKNARISGLDPTAFAVALKAAEGRQSIDEAVLKSAVAPALAGGTLEVAASEIPFNVKDGRLRAGPSTLEGKGAKAVVSGGYDVSADQIDIRAALSSTADGLTEGGVSGGRTNGPDITLFVHGTPDAPSVMLDLSSLSSWLALRAIEQETQRLDAIERGTGRTPPPVGVAADRPPSAPHATPAPVNPGRTEPKPQPHPQPDSAPKPESRPAPAPAGDGTNAGPSGRASGGAHESAPLPVSRPPSAPATSAPPSASPSAPPQSAAAPLPPPIEVRPAPGASPQRPQARPQASPQARPQTSPQANPQPRPAPRPPISLTPSGIAPARP